MDGLGLLLVYLVVNLLLNMELLRLLETNLKMEYIITYATFIVCEVLEVGFE